MLRSSRTGTVGHPNRRTSHRYKYASSPPGAPRTGLLSCLPFIHRIIPVLLSCATSPRFRLFRWEGEIEPHFLDARV